MIEIVPATAALLHEYYGDMSFPTLRAWVWLEDDKPVAVAGFIRISGKVMAIFSESKEGVRERNKVKAFKFAKMLLQIADEKGWILVADPDSDIATAPNFLLRLGFEPIETGEYVR